MHRGLRVTPVVLALFAAFLLTAGLVVSNVTLSYDEEILRGVAAVRSDALTAIMRFFSLMGHGDVEIPFALAVVGLLRLRGERWRAGRYLLAVLSGELLYVILKAGFHRHRPEIIPKLSDAGWYSFPSGHAMLAPVIYVFGLVLLARTMQWGIWRFILLGLGFVLPLAIALSRVYLGVHYPSDVVAGLFIGSGWALLWSGEASRPSARDTSSAPTTR